MTRILAILLLIECVPLVQAADDCLMSVDSYRAQSKKSAYLIIDTRSKLDYKKYWISGSVNFSSYTIKTKNYLRDKKLVLVNDGKNEESLVNLCQSLRKLQFNDIHVLKGGLPAWRKSFGDMEGDRVAQLELNTVSEKELYAIRNDPNWKLVSTQKQAGAFASVTAAQGGKLLKNALFVKREQKQKSFVKNIQQALGKGSQVNNLVFTNKHEFEKAASLPLMKKYNIFYMQNSMSNYVRYLGRYAGERKLVSNKRSQCQ
ncbi:MAG: rhodanese-like domain-containing protein [Gammaproteobacteria bacterium]|nr:rhodanese-like domain-containing protein [Gammaproteobacteria bacterium]MDH5802734.1 rhodanese-like domain-containing protein [Gammaproteobacteria bacterium]